MPLAGIYAITDDALLAEHDLLIAAEEALSGGISLLQFRRKLGSAEEKLATAKALVELCRQYDVPLLINDDVELCRAAGAQGVHLGQQDQPLAQTRAALGADAIIGITCHASVDLALQAESQGADYVAFGRFFPSATKPEAPSAPLEILAAAKQALSIPIVAIGGINAENGASVLQAGADMLAVIEAIFGNQQIKRETEKLVDLCAPSAAQN